MGDINGSVSVFNSYLSRLGVPPSRKIPDGVTIVQLGDVVAVPRKGRPFTDVQREENDMVVKMVRELVERNPHQYVQLLGNHEACYLEGGFIPSFWDVRMGLSPDAVASLESLFDAGGFHFLWHTQSAGSVSVFTHAGFTRGYARQMFPNQWDTGNPELVADVLESFRRTKGLGYLNAPGLLGAEFNPSSDFLWADAAREVYLPWMVHQDVPFTMIHSHSSPYCWKSQRWWPGMPPQVRTNTSVQETVRRSVTRLGPGKHQFAVSVGTIVSGPMDKPR